MFSANTTRVKQKCTNDFLTVNQNNCIAYDEVQISGNQINVAGDLKGGVLFNSSGTMNASCTINQQITQSVVSILSSTSDQLAKNSSDLFTFLTPSSGINTAWIDQTVTNNITSISSNTCNAYVSSQVTNNTINVGGNATNINAFNVTTNSTATCTINNTVDQEAYNSLQAKTQQSATNIGMFASIMSMLCIAAVIIVLGLAIIAGIGGAGAFMFKSKDKKEGREEYDEYGGDGDEGSDSYGDEYGGGEGPDSYGDNGDEDPN